MTQSYLEYLFISTFAPSDIEKPTLDDISISHQATLKSLLQAETLNPPVDVQYGREIQVKLADLTMCRLGYAQTQEDNNYSIQVATSGKVNKLEVVPAPSF